MTTPMIHQVAMILHCDGQQDQWDAMPQLLRDTAIADARRALEALREPTPEMIAAGTEAYAHQTYTAFTTEDEAARAIWQAMINTALGNEEGR